MDAREIIAGSLHNHGIAFPTPEEVSDWVVGQLHAAGYRIIHDSENHGPTLERAAGVADEIAGREYSASYRCGAADAATAIRAMEVKNNG